MEEAIGAVPRDRHGLHAGADRSGPFCERGTASKLGELGKVITGEPERTGSRGVELKHHDTAGDAAHLTRPGDRIGPVVVGQRAHRGVEGLVGEREAARAGSHAPSRARWPLGAHDGRRLYRRHVTIGRFIGTGARPTFKTVRASPSAAQTRAAIRGSVRRVAE
jgi:hypothetical protein